MLVGEGSAVGLGLPVSQHPRSKALIVYCPTMSNQDRGSPETIPEACNKRGEKAEGRGAIAAKFPELGNFAAIPMNIWGAVFSNDPHFALSQRSHSQRVFLEINTGQSEVLDCGSDLMATKKRRQY